MRKSLIGILSIAAAAVVALSTVGCSNCEKMADSIIVTKATMKILPDSIESFKRVARTVVSHSHQEEGCLNYAFYQDVTDSTIFFLYEEYVDRAALDTHLKKGYLEEFRTARQPMLDSDIPYVIYNSITTDNTVISRDMLKFDMKLSE